MFLTPSIHAAKIVANAKYGLQDGSGERNSTLVALPFFKGTLINAERFANDQAKYTDWATREAIKANLQFDLAILLDEFGYPPVTIDDVYKDVLEQAENFKKYA